MNKEDHYEDYAKKLANNHVDFKSFGWHDAPEDRSNWCVIYTHHRDSGIIEESNAAAIKKLLKPFLEVEDEEKLDIHEEHHGHFAVGWVDGYAIRVYERQCDHRNDIKYKVGRHYDQTIDGLVHCELPYNHIGDHDYVNHHPRVITAAFKAWADIQLSLESYPILDESDVSNREYETAITNIENAAKRFLKEGVADDWASDVYRWFNDNKPSAIESSDDQGAYPDDDDLKEALKALDYLEDEDEDE